MYAAFGLYRTLDTVLALALLLFHWNVPFISTAERYKKWNITASVTISKGIRTAVGNMYTQYGSIFPRQLAVTTRTLDLGDNKVMSNCIHFIMDSF
jgi:hypothetical protein